MNINFERFSRPNNKEASYIQDEIELTLEERSYKSFFSPNDFKTLRELESKLELSSQESFDPKYELKKILKMKPGNEKDFSLLIYKEKLVEQKIALLNLAENILDFTKDLRETPLKINQLNTFIEKYATEYKVSDEQVSRIFAAAELFVQKYNSVLAFFKKNNDDAYAMWAQIFNEPPRKEIRIKKGLTSIVFITTDTVDFSNLRSKAYCPSELVYLEIKPEDNSDTAGVHIAKPRNMPVSNISLIGVNGPLEAGEEEETIIHEETHAMNTIFTEFLHPKSKHIDFRSLRYLEKEQLPARAEKISRQYLNKITYRAKDEILAQMSENLVTGPSVCNYIIETISRMGDAYDYGRSDRLEEIDEILTKRNIEGAREIYNSIKNRFTEEYADLIKNGVNAVAEMQKRGYPNKIINLLFLSERLKHWPKISKRFTLDYRAADGVVFKKPETVAHKSTHQDHIDGFANETLGDFFPENLK